MRDTWMLLPLRDMWMLLPLLSLACAGTSETTRHRPLSDDAIAAFGADRGAPVATEPSSTAQTAIELADGERLEELRALIRFEGGRGTDPACALYALRVHVEGLSEGRATVACDAADPTSVVSFAPVEEARGPRLVAALTGARLEPRSGAEAAPSPRAVHLWLTTNRRAVDGAADPVRWPSPDAEATETPRERSPDNLSEVWEAVMYPHRYR